MAGELLGWAMVVLFAALVVLILLLGLLHPKSGADVLRWHPTRSPELEAQNEVDDVAQMLEGVNERRRRRGAAELTEEGLAATVREERRALAAHREAHLLDLELEQVLEARNARRRRRGLPEMTLEELRASLERAGGR